jgi:8-oxo-dGTP pyrophosphatase MutT (NUDIX family)
MKVTSSAVFFTNKQKFLAVHPTNHPIDYFDLPKGIIDNGESPDEAAVREFKEETGYKLIKSSLQYFGKYPLHKNKDIELFLYIINDLPKLSSFVCKSMTDVYGLPVPEVDRFIYVDLNDSTKLRKELKKVQMNIIKSFKEK